MAKPSIRWLPLTGTSEGGGSRPRFAVVVTDPAWAQGIESLIRLSREYRDAGLLVTNVGPGSAAARAGVERGDVLLRYDGVPLAGGSQLRSLENRLAEGTNPRQIALDAARGSREMTFTVPAGRLGITVGPFLARLSNPRRGRGELIRLSASEGDEETDDSGQATVLEVPSEFVPGLAPFTEALQRPRNARQGKLTQALVIAAASVS